ncbi:MAG: hypothetical protein M1838_005695 [Thelocarpon superellum]|nr:MAG: hypothetical protein M1838_005695 [Thelocarpon superellum]
MALNASLSLRPEVLITISLFDNAATVGAGFYVDLPRVSVEVAQVFDVDAQCERTSTSASAFSDLQYAAASLKFGSLTHLVPHVELDLGVNMYAHLEEPFSSADDKNGSLTTDLVLLQTTYALPTACLSFDAEHKTFLDAQLAAQQLAATGTAVDDAHTTKTTTKTTSGAGRSLAWPLNDGALTVLMATVTVTVMLL